MTVNIVSIILATTLNMVLGALWYSPVMFAKPWMKLIGKNMKDLSREVGQTGYIFSFIGSVVTALILEYLIELTGMVTLIQGAILGFLIGLGFLATTMLSDYMFAARPLKLYYINLGYRWLGFILMGTIIGLLG